MRVREIQLIFTETDNKTTAVKIGKGLLKLKLIACYNLMPVESAYWWKGKIVDSKEFLLILKTKAVNFQKVDSYIKKHSTYQIPEVIGIKPQNINKKYLNWIKLETHKG